jgi:hypothetical protein
VDWHVNCVDMDRHELVLVGGSNMGTEVAGRKAGGEECGLKSRVLYCRVKTPFMF